MDLYDVLIYFLSDKPEMKHLLTVDGKAFVSYLTYILEKLNMLNKYLQQSNRTHVDTKVKSLASLLLLMYLPKTYQKNYDQFHWQIDVR